VAIALLVALGTAYFASASAAQTVTPTRTATPTATATATPTAIPTATANWGVWVELLEGCCPEAIARNELKHE
jgi:hypothetical protein